VYGTPLTSHFDNNELVRYIMLTHLTASYNINVTDVGEVHLSNARETDVPAGPASGGAAPRALSGGDAAPTRPLELFTVRVPDPAVTRDAFGEEG